MVQTMDKIKAIEKYVKKLKDETPDGDFNGELSLASDGADFNLNPLYRADIGYMWTGSWETSIMGALLGLYDELVRVGEIKEEAR